MLIAVTGALAGLFHVLSGPDHLAAVGPLALDSRRRGWLAGWTWGIGHASGVVLVATLAILLRDLLPSVDRISAWSERLVGAALIAVGLWALRRSARVRPAPHAHGAVSHDHLHVQAGPRWMRRIGHAHAAFCLGVLHGVAGSSHFVGVLPALALPTRTGALTYIVAFWRWNRRRDDRVCRNDGVRRRLRTRTVPCVPRHDSHGRYRRHCDWRRVAGRLG